MPKQISYTLNDEELKQIEAAMREDPRAEVVRRATAIHALHLGHKPEMVAQMVKAGKSTVNTWHHGGQAGSKDWRINHAADDRPKPMEATKQLWKRR